MTARRPPRPMLRALRHRNYRLYFSGQSISLIGSWMTRVAANWLVWRLTHAPEMLGILGFCSQVPTFVLAPLAGVWVDRLNRHTLIVTTQILAMLQSFALAALVLTGVVKVWEILALQALQGVINAFDMPARQAFLVELIEDRGDLSNAVALNSSMVNGARLIGPSIAGLLIAWVGEGWCFFVDGASYLAVIASLLLMHIALQSRQPGDRKVLHELREGLHYALGLAPIRAILMMVAMLGLVGMSYSTLLPVVASRVLHGGAHTLGFLMGAMGVGALVAALYLASRETVIGLGKLIAAAAGTFGLGLAALALSRSFPLSLLIMFVIGMGFMLQLASSNTLLQTLVREDMRGRVMSFYTMSFMGMVPFGSLLAGAVAAKAGAPLTILGSGVICLAGAAVFARQLPALRRIVHPIYVERGILPPVASGLRDATALREEAGQ